MADAHMLKNLSLSPELFLGSKLLAFQQKIIQCINFLKLGHPILQLVMCQYVGIPKIFGMAV